MSDQAATFTLHGREKLFNLVEDCLTGAPGNTELVLEAEQESVTRYANNRIHQNVWENDNRLWVRVEIGGAMATLACHSLDPARIRETMAQAATIARRLPSQGRQGFAASSQESGSNLEPGAETLAIPPRDATPAPSFFETTANQSPTDRAAAIGQIVELIAGAGFQGYGTYKTTCSELAVVNSQGLRAYAPATSGYIKVLAESEGGAGFADRLARDVSQLDPVAAANQAIQKCRLNLNQRDLSPGDYAVVLEPNAVADMVRFMVIHGCGAQQLQDGRSFMAGRFGEQVTGANINLWEDPNHPQAMPFGLDYEGMQSRPVPLVLEGKAAGVVYDRATASRTPGRVSTGHAITPSQQSFTDGPQANHIVMEAGTKTTAELVAGLKRGLVVTRFHYTHCPDPKRVVATGTTRDGTFLVEDGEIVAAVKNLRFTQSVLELLAGVEEFGQPKTCQDWWAANGMATTFYYLPGLRVNRCTFTGVTTF